jgi:hypothetical protein
MKNRGRSSRRANALVEFALVLPAVILLTAGLFSLVLTGFRQIALDAECVRLARKLSLTPAGEAFDLPPTAEVEVKEIPLEAPSLLRRRRAPRILSVTLRRATRFWGRPLELVSYAEDVWLGPESR